MRPVQVFLSYRRDDSAGYARAIHEALAAQFGDDRVFIDVDDIGAGQAFDEVITQAVGQSEVLLVLIGRRWLGEPGGAGAAASRLHQPGDFVRREVEAALAKGMRVVPLLLDGATMPVAEQLPQTMRALATRHALAIDNTRFADDLQRLVAALRGWLGEPVATRVAAAGEPAADPGRSPGPARRWRGPAWGLALLAAAALALQQAGWPPFAARTPAPAPGAAPAAAVGPAAPPAAGPAARPAINGRWTAELNYGWPGARYSEQFNFSGDGGTLLGSVSFLRVPRGILRGELVGHSLRFDTESSELLGDQTRTLTHHYRLELAGDTLRGTLQTEGGSSANGPVAFVARRAPAP